MTTANALNIVFTPNQLIYASGATTLTGLPTIINGVLVTSAGGVPSISNTLPLAVQNNITQVGTIIAGVWNGTPIDPAHGGTGSALVPSVGGIVYSTAAALAILPGTATAQQILMSGALAPPAWSTAIYPATTTVNQILYSSAGNVIGGLATANNGALVTSNAGVPSVLAGPGTTGNIFQSNAAAAPSFSTATYPSTTTINRIFYSTANNVVGELATTNSASLSTTSAGAPAWLALTNGQIVIGSTGGNPAAATITAGTGTSITNAANSITNKIIINDMCQGRMTLTSGLAVTFNDTTSTGGGAGTIFFTPYKGNYITLFTGAVWTLYQFTERSLTIPNTASQMYDLYLFDSAGTLTLEAVAWTNDTTRATALAIQDGVYCKTGALDRRYLGSFRTNATAGAVPDTSAQRFVWNYYNRVKKPMLAQDSTASWNYTTATYRQARATTTNQLDLVMGIVEDEIEASVHAAFSNTNTTVSVASGIGINSTSTDASGNIKNYANSNVANGIIPISCFFRGYLAVGRNTVVWLEYSTATGTTTFYGNGTNLGFSGISGCVLC